MDANGIKQFLLVCVLHVFVWLHMGEMEKEVDISFFYYYYFYLNEVNAVRSMEERLY